MSENTQMKYFKYVCVTEPHNSKWSFDNFLDLLVGRDDGGRWDLKGRTASQEISPFPELWTNVVGTLSHGRHQILASLTDSVINRAGAVWMGRWLRICSISMSQTRIGELRARLTEL